NLSWLFCQNNQIENLDVSQNLQLSRLYCQDNFIDSLDVSTNTELFTFVCNNNQLTYLNINNGLNTNFVIFSAISNPNLLCIQVDNVSYANSMTCSSPIPNWCKDDTAEYSEDCDNLSVEDVLGNNAFSLYPNPIKDKLFVENVAENIHLSSIKIYNLQGSVVLNITNIENAINVSNLTSGLYFCNLYTSKGVFTYKILKR